MLCKNRITLIGFLGQDAESSSTPNGTTYTRFSLATSVGWKEKGSNEYKARTEWHRVICWNKLAQWAATLQKGAYIEVEGELRYREYTPTESDRSVRGIYEKAGCCSSSRLRKPGFVQRNGADRSCSISVLQNRIATAESLGNGFVQWASQDTSA